MESDNKVLVSYYFDRVVTIAELEKLHILKALELAGGNKTHAAEKLGVSLKTLYNKLNEYNKAEKTEASNEVSSGQGTSN